VTEEFDGGQGLSFGHGPHLRENFWPMDVLEVLE